MSWIGKFLLGGGCGLVLTTAIAIPVLHYAETGGLAAVDADLRGAGKAIKDSLRPAIASEPQAMSAEEIAARERARALAQAQLSALQNQQGAQSGRIQSMFDATALSAEDLARLKPYADRILAHQERTGQPMGLATMSNPETMAALSGGGGLPGMDAGKLTAILGQIGGEGQGGVAKFQKVLQDRVLNQALGGACDPGTVAQLSLRDRAVRAAECRKAAGMAEKLASGDMAGLTGMTGLSTGGLPGLSVLGGTPTGGLSSACAQNPSPDLSPEDRATRAKICRTIMDNANPRATAALSGGFELPFGLQALINSQ